MPGNPAALPFAEPQGPKPKSEPQIQHTQVELRKENQALPFKKALQEAKGHIVSIGVHWMRVDDASHGMSAFLPRRNRPYL